MSDNEKNEFQSDAISDLRRVMERIRLRLHEATVNAPPQIYQAIEELKERTQSRLEHTEQQVSDIAHDLGESEEDLLEWLKLDIRSLEQRLLKSLMNTTDTSRVELQKWLNRGTDKED